MKIGIVTNFDMFYPNLQKKLGKTVDFENFWKKSKIGHFRISYFFFPRKVWNMRFFCGFPRFIGVLHLFMMKEFKSDAMETCD